MEKRKNTLRDIRRDESVCRKTVGDICRLCNTLGCRRARREESRGCEKEHIEESEGREAGDRAKEKHWS